MLFLRNLFYLYDLWMKQHPEYTYDSYNLSFDRKKKPRRDADVFKDADVVVIPSDSEFRYHGALQIDPRDLETSNNFIEEIKPHMEGKTVIMWRSDRGDTEELYRNETFKGVTLGDFHTIDEIDFPANIHGMKHHFIREAFFNNPLASLMSTELPQVDFAYWGRMKDGDDRGKIIRQLYRDPDITQILVGGFPSGVKRQASWIKEWSELFSYVSKARCTLCFNWRDPTATTSRYPEALAVGLVPFVWKDYDKNNTYAIEDFQRVSSFEELREKILSLKEDDLYSTALQEFQKNYKDILPSKLEYSEMFTQKMDKYLRR